MTTYTFVNKPATDYSFQNPPSTNYSFTTKPTNTRNEFLLLENGYKLLQENESKLITMTGGSIYTYQSKP